MYTYTASSSSSSSLSHTPSPLTPHLTTLASTLTSHPAATEYSTLVQADSHLEPDVDFVPLTSEVSTHSRSSFFLPLAHSAVRLTSPEGEDLFIHANHVTLGPDAYIAAQGPVRSSVSRFWRMVWETNVTVIAMMSGLTEGDGDAETQKVYPYWPKRGSFDTGSLTVFYGEKKAFPSYKIRKLVLTHNATGETRCISQFQIGEWLDMSVPDLSMFDDVMAAVAAKQARSAASSSSPHPLLVHCSLGIGRTGTFIAAHALRTQIMEVVAAAQAASAQTLPDAFPDILGTVDLLRKQRAFAVQTPEQYAFLYQYASHLLLSLAHIDNPHND